MNTFIKILIFFLFGSYYTFSQVMGNYESDFQTLFDKKEKVNPYYFGHNPAWLGNEVSNEFLYIKSNVNDETGDFRKFTDPGDIRYYSFSVTGKKQIDSSQVFRGSFGFQRTENNNWQWLFTRDYSSGSQFLIGDSTTGDSRFNGIMINAEYAAKIFEVFDLGFSINYNVDDGLKIAHPRPTSLDREINFSSGLAFHIDKNLSVGLKASIYDNLEHINYSQDPGAITTEIILIKFRGYDYPNVLRMASESRYSYNNGYSAGLNFQFEQSSIFTLTAFADAGFNKINIKDGGSNPISEGLWKNNFFSSGLVSLFKLSNSTFLSLLYTINLGNNWAKYPAYNVVYSKNWFNENSIISGVEYSFTNQLTAGLEGGVKFTSNNFNDYYSNIFSNNKIFTYLLNLGLKFDLNNNLSFFISAGVHSIKTINNNLDYSTQSGYFINYRIKDLYFYQTDFKQYLFNLITAYSPGFGGELIVNLNYSNAIPGKYSQFQNLKRSYSGITLEYRVAAY